ncbi:hypothetical protein C8R43DRAFT_989894 [Mycena crocata]|nr:hypothetical protein C8R43DRAFT_989894 [Mycena crocata]
MASNWPVFITAPRPSSKALNRAFLLIQDFEFTEYPDESSWILLASKELPTDPPASTRLPLPDLSGNDFAGMSLANINNFVRSHEERLKELELSSTNWVIIDRKGLETSTCIVCDRFYNSGEEGGEEGVTDEFRACRLPYEVAWSMISNLDIANMGFEEFVDEEAGEQEDGTWKWASFTADTEEPSGEKSAVELKREGELRKLRDAGHAD